MNLLYGSQEPSLFESLKTACRERYQIEGKTVWSSESELNAGYLTHCEGNLIGQVEDPKTGCAILFIGVLNHETGLAVHPDKDAARVLECYQKSSYEGLADFIGQFLIVIRDKQRQRISVYPDSGGMRSVFYTVDEGKLSFSTNLGTLAAALGEKLKPETMHQDFFLSHGFFPFHGTPYEGINILPPNQILIAEGGEVRLEHRPESRSKYQSEVRMDNLSEDEVMDKLYDSFVFAMKEQLTPDKKVGVLLGGFDSALVAAFLARSGKEVHTYSFGYEDEGFNQAHTDTVAKHLDCHHHWIPINTEVISRGLEEFDLFFNAPTNWMNYVIQTEEVARQICKDGIRHVYSGDGCDAAFLGYPRVHTTSILFQRLGRWPKGMVRTLISILNIAWLDNVMGRPYTLAMHLLRTMGRDMPERGFLTVRVLDKNSISHMKGPHYTESVTDDEVLLKQIAFPLKGKSPARVAYGGKGFLSPNRSKIIGSSDSTGISIQAPYMHPRLKAFALSLPDELLRPKEKGLGEAAGKYILMKMAEKKNLLPHDAIYQKKFAAVEAPVDEWLKEEMRNQCLKTLQDLPFRMNSAFRDALLKKKWLEELYRRRLASDSLTTHALSLLLTYSRFTRHLLSVRDSTAR